MVQSAVVVGAGIAGLTAAVALRRAGLKVTVLEQREAWRSQGGVGMTLVGNALAALDRLGLAKACIAAGMPDDHFVLRNADGSFRARADDAMLGGPDVPGHAGIARMSLHAILADAALNADARVVSGAQIASIDASDPAGGASATTRDGQRYEGDLLVGADGIYSTVRQALFPNVTIAQSGQVAWRAEVLCPDDIRTTHAFLDGPAGLVGVCPIAPGLAYVYVIEAGQGERFDETQLHTLLQQRLQGYGGPIPAMAQSLTSDSEISVRPLEWHLAPAPWHRANAILIGDAAHSNPPVLAQGAAMGIEDAVVLAEEIARTASLQQAFDAFQSRRWPRVRAVVENSVALSRSRVTHRGAEAALLARRLVDETNAVLAGPI